MGYAGILVLSILMIISFFVHSFVPETTSYYVNGISFYAIIILNVILAFMVFVDSKKYSLSKGHTASALFLGGIGGILYLLARGTNPSPSENPALMSNSSKRNSRIFSYIMAFLFGLPLLYMALTGYSLNEPIIMIFGVIVLLSLIMAFFARSKYN